MAVSERYLIIGTLLACGAIAALKLPPAQRASTSARTTVATKEARARDRLGTHLRREMNTLVLLERRDAMLRQMATAGGREEPFVVYDDHVPQRVRDLIGREIARERAGPEPLARAFRLGVAVVVDTGIADAPPFAPAPSTRPADWRSSYSAAGWLDAQHLLPRATGGHACLSIVRVGPRVLASPYDAATERELVRSVARLAGSFLGPCAYYGAYGQPGEAVERWLATTNLDLALRAPVPAVDSVRRDPFHLAFPAKPSRIPSRWMLDLAWSENRTWMHSDLVRCAEGDLGECGAALAANRSTTAPGRTPWIVVQEGRRFVGGLPLGPSEAWFLAGLHERMGPERFGRFWRSPLEPEAAFADVMGITLAEAAREWAAETYSAGARRRWPHPLALAGQLLFVGVVVGSTALRRR